ncbi:S8 family serine peptidase [Fredinandcohnia salidurans]|uniref:S8 family serine peptidase n=1 Tax=Fredinandcohnia salidurans TaxID=2595041 RepID=A0ABW4MQN0_9BACI
MRKKRTLKPIFILLIFLLAFSSFGMGAFAQTNDTNSSAPKQLAELHGNIDLKSSKSTTVIVEMTETSIVESKHAGKSQTKANLANERKKVKDTVKQAAKSSKVNREYDYVFSGFSVELKANEIPALLSVPGVKAVYPDVEYTITEDTDETISQEEFSPQMADSAPFIGANDAWEAGYTGKGITVAVIDTGADYTHPDLNHAFGDYKGWDFVDNDNDPQETPANDPRGAKTDHGTHVSGTVAANGGIKGVSPEATLLAYRVLGPGGSGTSENVIAGIEKAVQDGADVMNLSLGNSLNDPDYATSIALDWAMAEGVVAVTSNGNAGPANWTVGSPGTSREAISVGATQLPYNVYNASISTTDGVTYPSAKVQGFPSDDELLALNGKEFEFVHVGFGSPAEIAGKDLQGKIALISRGAGIAFVDKASAAKAAGAVGAIIYNNVAGEQPDVPGMAVPTIKISQEDGTKLLTELENGTNKVSFNIEFSHGVGELMADFSSRGPVTQTWMIKPDVSAPGVNITSTIPGGYGAKQGTSMASPHVAGAAALVLQAHPDWSVEDVKAALMNTAVELKDANGNVYPHNTQGAGSIRPLDAIKTETLATPGSHSFGVFYKDKGKQVEKQHFTLENLSKERKTYSFDVTFAGNPAGIKVMTSNNLKVNAGQTQKVNLNVQVDAGNLAPGYYEGSIKISDGKVTFDVPTILFVKEPDYPRAEAVFVSFGENGNLTQVGGLFPGGAESVEFFVYRSNAAGQALEYLGDIAFYENVPAGYQYFDWDGTLTNGVTLAKGQYYNVYAYATYKGQSDLAGTNFRY